MAEQVTNYQCPACTGPLHFSGESESVECEYCGSSFRVEEIEALYREKNQNAENAFDTEEKKRQDEETAKDWDTSELSDDWGEDADGMRVYNCPSCGAELVCDETTAATSCPYCDNPSIVPGQFAGTLKPDLIIPFKISKDEAIAGLKKHYKGKILLPKIFSDENHLQEIKGIYVPFWLYDAKADTDCTFYANRTHTHRRGDYRITETDHFTVVRSGIVEFDRIPADASKKMADAYMDSIEPFDYNGLKPFSKAYLPGYFADKYDVTAEENAERADERCRSSALRMMRADVKGYTLVQETSGQVRIRRGKVNYALMPVWMLRTKWQDKEYMFMMNGQTGKMVGDLPISKSKYRAIFWGLFAGLTGFFMFSGIGSGLAMMLGALIGG